MPNLENLIGHSFADRPERINRKGRPKRLPEIDQLLVELLGSTGEKSRMRELLEAMIKLAIGGNIRAAEMLLTRAYGKPKETVDINLAAQSDDSPKIIPTCDGYFKDERGNVIGTINPDKMKDFNFQFVFVGDDDDDEIYGYAGNSLGYTVRDKDGNITQLPPALEQLKKNQP